MTLSLPAYWFVGSSKDGRESIAWRRSGTESAAENPTNAGAPSIDHRLGLPIADVIRGIQGGDERLFGRVFDAYWVPLSRFAALYTKSDDEAQDVTAQVFAALWQRHAEWASVRSIELYLFGAVRNRARNLHRAAERAERHRADALVTGEFPATGEAFLRADDAVVADERRAILLRAVNGLKERPREVLLLRWLRGLEFEEIATLLGATRNAVYVNYHRAIAQLRETLPDYFE